MEPLKICMGWDSREEIAYSVAEYSIAKRSNYPVEIIPLKASDLSKAGLLNRTVVVKNGQSWDVISEAPQSTEFAISRFLTPLVVKTGFVVFMDCDIVCRADIKELFDLADPRYAVQCVKHNYKPIEGQKMDGQLQTLYQRKNWSSVMMFNCDHPANKWLTVETINAMPGRFLHAFSWLNNEQIGGLPKEWNCLVGEEGYNIEEAKLLHYTRGGPWMKVSNGELADKIWRDEHYGYINS